MALMFALIMSAAIVSSQDVVMSYWKENQDLAGYEFMQNITFVYNTNQLRCAWKCSFDSQCRSWTYSGSNCIGYNSLFTGLGNSVLSGTARYYIRHDSDVCCAIDGMPENQIKCSGRWKSKVHKKYVYQNIVDGQWTEWKADGPCSVTCGIGIQLLHRECTNPAPENGGQLCEGDRIKQIECNQQACCPKNKEDISFECNGGWIRNDDFGACYCFSLTKATWYNAQTLCKKQSAILSYVYSLKESDWISANCKKHLGANSWIGGKRVNDRYEWVFETGTRTMNFTNWAAGQPLSYPLIYTFICVQLWEAQRYKWDDFDCTKEQNFVCKSLL